MSCAVETMFPPLPPTPTFRETVFLFPPPTLHRHRSPHFPVSPGSRNIHLLKIIVLVFLCVRVTHFRSSRVVPLASLLQVYGFSFVLLSFATTPAASSPVEANRPTEIHLADPRSDLRGVDTVCGDSPTPVSLPRRGSRASRSTVRHTKVIKICSSTRVPVR